MKCRISPQSSEARHRDLRHLVAAQRSGVVVAGDDACRAPCTNTAPRVTPLTRCGQRFSSPTPSAPIVIESAVVGSAQLATRRIDGLDRSARLRDSDPAAPATRHRAASRSDSYRPYARRAASTDASTSRSRSAGRSPRSPRDSGCACPESADRARRTSSARRRRASTAGPQRLRCLLVQSSAHSSANR